MALTQFLVVYSVVTAQIRRYFYPDDDSELASYPLLPGEASVMVGIGPYKDAAAEQAAIDSAVQAAAGKPPGNPRCVVIDANGNVVRCIMADPAIDTIAGMRLINHPTADIGWTWNQASGFAAPLPGPVTGTHKLPPPEVP